MGKTVDLCGEPATVACLDDRVDLQVIAVSIVADGRSANLGVDSQVSHYERLKQETKVLQVGEQLAWVEPSARA